MLSFWSKVRPGDVKIIEFPGRKEHGEGTEGAKIFLRRQRSLLLPLRGIIRFGMLDSIITTPIIATHFYYFSKLAPGFYVVNVSCGTEMVQQKIIKK